MRRKRQGKAGVVGEMRREAEKDVEKIPVEMGKNDDMELFLQNELVQVPFPIAFLLLLYYKKQFRFY